MLRTFLKNESGVTTLEYCIMLGVLVCIVAVIAGPVQNFMFESWSDSGDKISDALGANSSDPPVRGYGSSGASSVDF